MIGKKAFLVAIIITAFLVSTVAGMQAVKMAKANFLPTEEPSIPPIIIIQSPLNITYDQNEVWLNFTVYVTPVWSGSYHLVDVYYECDGKPVHFNVAPLAVNPSFSGNLTGLTKGEHNLTAIAYGTGLYYTNSSTHETATYSLTGNQTVIFTVNKDLETTPSPSPSPSPDLSPTISILSPSNDSFFASAGPLVSFPFIYETNQSPSWVGYSIDGGSNVTISSNQTISVDSSSHNLTVYANDTFGNWAIPQTVNYVVAINLGTASTPSPSPTQQPTMEPIVTPNDAQENFALVLIIAVTVVVIVAVAGALFYFKRRKGKL